MTEVDGWSTSIIELRREVIQPGPGAGEFECFDYPDDVKKMIIGDFRRVFDKEPHEPVTPFIDDIVETAQLREIRVFPENELMYVRAEVRLRGANGVFGGWYQVLALWDCFYVLKSYTFVRGEVRKSVVPIEMGVANVRGCTRRARIPAELRTRETDVVYVARQLKRASFLAKRRGKEEGDPMAQYNLGGLIGEKCDKLSRAEFKEMRSLLVAAAEQNFPAALRRLWLCADCLHCGVFNPAEAAAYQARYKELKKDADSSGRLPIHRTTRYPGLLPLGVKF